LLHPKKSDTSSDVLSKKLNHRSATACKGESTAQAGCFKLTGQEFLSAAGKQAASVRETEEKQQRNAAATMRRCFITTCKEGERGVMKKQTPCTVTVFTAALLLSASAAAALEIQSGSDKVQLQLYGEIDRAVMYADDGNQDKVFHVDNSNSETKIGLTGEVAATPCLTVGGNLEYVWQSNPSNAVSMEEESIAGEFGAELVELYLAGDLGKLSLGKGEMASDVSGEHDLSGTDVVGNVGFADIGGGLTFFDSTNNAYSAAGFTADAVFNGGLSSEGLGKANRVRYDTPSFGGFTLSGAIGEEEISDVALEYAGVFSGGELEAEVAWFNADEGWSQISGSASVLFSTGLNFTIAASSKDVDDMPANGDDPTFIYGKIGYIADQLCPVGSTAISVDYGMYNNAAALDIGQEAVGFGVQLVQELAAWSTDLYAGYRLLSLEDDTAIEYEDISIITAGARFSF
jgi:hypothetical protein